MKLSLQHNFIKGVNAIPHLAYLSEVSIFNLSHKVKNIPIPPFSAVTQVQPGRRGVIIIIMIVEDTQGSGKVGQEVGAGVLNS